MGKSTQRSEPKSGWLKEGLEETRQDINTWPQWMRTHIDKRVFIICPVRNATPQVKKRLKKYVAELENKGYIVHYPPRDTDQSDPVGNKICEENAYAMLDSDEIHIFYDGNSTGLFFDLGITFILTQIFDYKKKIVFINKDEIPDNEGKSFQKVLAFLEEQTKTPD